MPSEPGFPQVMVHPHHRPAEVRDFNAGESLPGMPERFPPVEVHGADQEAQQRARGYLRYGEKMAKIAEYSEFPKMLHHPDHVAAVQPTQGAKMENGQLVAYTIAGTAAKLSPVTVQNAEEQASWETKGYAAPAAADAELAFDKAQAAPGKPGDEWPKWVDGVLAQDPDAPVDDSGQYPKWLHFEGGDSVLVQDAAHEGRVLESRGSSRNEPTRQPDKPYVPPVVPPDPAALAEFEEFRAWKEAKEKAQTAAVADAKYEEERETLLALAEESGIKIDRRWGLEKLRETVMGAEAAD